jgi:geranylgeranyl diphosphate synthase, type I
VTITPAPPQGLQDARRLVQPGLRAAVSRLDPTTRAMTGYHFGWLEADGTAADSDGGKAVRPMLALLSARAVGAAPEVAVPGAVAVELVHNFSLLHDDLMDGDTERRHRTTVWALWGGPSAILTGDALLGLAQEVLLDVPDPTGPAAARLLARATRELIRGQVEDMAYEGRPEIDVAAVLAMAEAKTAALLSASTAIGAVLANGPAHAVAGLADYGRHLGLAFQLVDDVLGIWGDPAVTGKPARSDLRSRKTSLPVARVIGLGGPAADEVSRWLAAEDEVDEDLLNRIAAVVEQAGGRAWARHEAARHADAAAAALAGVGAPADVRAELQELAAFVVGRET